MPRRKRPDGGPPSPRQARAGKQLWLWSRIPFGPHGQFAFSLLRSLLPFNHQQRRSRPRFLQHNPAPSFLETSSFLEHFCICHDVADMCRIELASVLLFPHMGGGGDDDGGSPTLPVPADWIMGRGKSEAGCVITGFQVLLNRQNTS